MRLSVIIVSYNVYPFLDNCLRSVQQAMKGLDSEIIVVDNASVDRTQQLVQQHFQNIKLIGNKENVGFAKANNQAIQQSQGEYIVLLNPDTVVSEDTFSTCLDFMDRHEDAGAVGVKMLDGSGVYLPESKRGLPTLRASFMKLTGLYKLFPRSGFMNSYYMGHIDKEEQAEIEVLTGAFMFIRKSVLEKTGLLDEAFFMYGEDIDLSYRITQAGYKIYYLPSTSIIHYKGESTKKSTLNYLLTFYQAMLIFTEKHRKFSGQKNLIQVAIYLHGFVRFAKQFIKKLWPVLLDAILISFSFFVVSKLWAHYYYKEPAYFRDAFYLINIPVYTGIAILSLFLNGAYDKPYSVKSSWLGFGWAVILILIVYAFLPIHMRTSRMVIVLGSLLFMFLLLLTRWKVFPWSSSRNKFQQDDRRAVIVASPEESNRIKELINRSRDHIDIVGIVEPDVNVRASADHSLGSIDQLAEIIRVHDVKEIIFSASDIPFSTFTSQVTSLGPGQRYMLAASTTMNIVGSMNRDTEGEAYAIRVDFKIAHPASKRAKRIFDLVAGIFFLLVSPVLFFFIKHRSYLWSNIFRVLTGSLTWVSYHPDDPMFRVLPRLKAGVLTPQFTQEEINSPRKLEHTDYVYARDYHWTTDLSLLSTQWEKTGQKPFIYGA